MWSSIKKTIIRSGGHTSEKTERRPMTKAEEKRFEAAMKKVDQAMKKMDEAFGEIGKL